MMKTSFRHIISALALSLLISGPLQAQDARQRTPVTIVADVLAEIPYSQRADFDTAMNDLLGTGEAGVEKLASMLVPAAEGQNNLVEYALDGLVAYTSANATDEQRAAVCKGLATSIEKCSDTPNKAFLLSLLARVSRAEDAAVFEKYLTDPELSEWAVSGLALTPGAEATVTTLVEADKLPAGVIARLAAKTGNTTAEAYLLGKLKKADSETAASIYRSLSAIGGVKSLPVLAKAAAKEKYEWLPEDATACYARLLNRLAADPSARKSVVKDAGSLLKKAKSSHVRIAALAALFTAEGAEATPLLAKAITDGDRAYRVAALRLCEPWANDETYAMIGATAMNPKVNDRVKTDIINWLGTNKIASQEDAVIANIESTDTELALAAIAAASRIGGEKALAALVANLGSTNAPAVTKALLAFNGNIGEAVNGVLTSSKDNNARANALTVASARHIKEAAPTVFTLLDDPTLGDKAYASLAGVVTPGDLPRLATLLEKASGEKASTIQRALISAVAGLDNAEKYSALQPQMAASSRPELYYRAIALTASPEAIATLTEAYNVPATRDEALEALLTVDSPEMIDVIFNIAANDEKANTKALQRYAALVTKYGKDPINRYQLFKQGLEIAKEAPAVNTMLNGLADTATYPALTLARKYADQPASAMTAAAAIRYIMSKNIDNFTTDEAKEALVKAADIYRTDVNNPDAGYAVDDINGMLAKLDAKKANAPLPTSKLTDQEVAEGWEMLFDGTEMNKWTGDKQTYIVKDGCITVNAAHWGNNIYTVDQYGDFVFRFEFSLDKPGVNNGVGIRTPMNVDAAFHGMEIQILDHDDPMYADIADIRFMVRYMV